MRPATPQPRAFTLVELLVVIGIIALLIAILLPVLSKARQASLTLKCLAVERAMAQAALSHAQEHRGILPLAGLQHSYSADYCTPDGLGDSGRQKYVYFRQTTGARPGVDRPAPLPAVLAPYLGVSVDLGSTEGLLADLNTDQALQRVICPAQDPATIISNVTIWQGNWTDAPAVKMGYIFNGYILSAQGIPTSYLDLFVHGRLAAIRRPDEVCLFADGRPYKSANPGYEVNQTLDHAWEDESRTSTLYECWIFRMSPPSPSQLIDQFDPGRHRGKINVVYLDGHAETLSFPSQADSTNGAFTDLHRAGITKGIYR